MQLNKLIKFFPITLLIVATFYLRFVNLGYSDFQGDEIKALFIPESGQSTLEFLLTQRKGPIQFFVTFAIKLIDPTYRNQLLVRTPFALAGLFSVYLFYKLLTLHFTEKIAFYASLFMACNGFFVAFSRIVQYQSFVILFMILSLYLFSLSLKVEKWRIKGLYLGFIFWSLSILSHYDGIFIFPFVGYLLFTWFDGNYCRTNLKHLLFAGTFFVFILSAFYVPFILSISDATMSYWEGRLVGTGGKISSSKYLFTVYQPIYAVHFYTILGAIGGLIIMTETMFQTFLYRLIEKFAHFVNFFTKIELEILPGKVLLRNIGLILWFLVPYVFLEFIVSIPGTHIYTYLVPLFIILGVGLNFIEKLFGKVFKSLSLKIVSVSLISGLFIFLFMQSNAIFVDNIKEYPWEQEQFFIWTFSKPTPIYHLSMFGFPYFRNWEGIADLVNSTPDGTGFYSTNERESITRYHIRLQKDTNLAGYFIYIKNPQSFTNEIINEKAEYWVSKYSPVFTFIKNGKEIVSVYNMEPGGLDEIIAKGY